jgi:TolB protein
MAGDFIWPGTIFMRLGQLLQLVVALVALFALPATPQAKVYIDINAPGVQKVPVAVPELRVTGSVDVNVVAKRPHLKVAEVLRRNLEWVGVFEMLDPKGYLEDPQMADLVPTSESFADWYMVGSELLIKGQLDQSGEELVVDLYAYDVFRREFLFGKRYRTKVEGIELVAHLFANTLMERFTGKKGPFGTEIAYAVRKGDTKELARINMDGTEPRRVTENRSLNLYPAWARDGKSLYLTSYYGGEPDLCQFSLEDKTLKYVHRSDGVDMPGEESPDGKQLVFAASANGNTDIYVMELATWKTKRITENRAIDVSPSWSPDGKQIAFVSDRKGNPHLFVMNADGSNVRRITFSGSHNGDPAWSPDGDKIAYSGMAGHGKFQVFWVDPEGRNTHQLTFGPYDSLEPSWAPDGRFLAISSKKDGESAIYVLRLGSKSMRRVTPKGQEATQPAWSHGFILH